MPYYTPDTFREKIKEIQSMFSNIHLNLPVYANGTSIFEVMGKIWRGRVMKTNTITFAFHGDSNMAVFTLYGLDFFFVSSKHIGDSIYIYLDVVMDDTMTDPSIDSGYMAVDGWDGKWSETPRSFMVDCSFVMELNEGSGDVLSDDDVIDLLRLVGSRL